MISFRKKEDTTSATPVSRGCFYHFLRRITHFLWYRSQVVWLGIVCAYVKPFPDVLRTWQSAILLQMHVDLRVEDNRTKQPCRIIRKKNISLINIQPIVIPYRRYTIFSRSKRNLVIDKILNISLMPSGLL